MEGLLSSPIALVELGQGPRVGFWDWGGSLRAPCLSLQSKPPCLSGWFSCPGSS